MLIRGGQIFSEDQGFTPGDLGISQGQICPPHSAEAGQILDAAGLYVIPGMIDIHCHGAKGSDFTDASPEAFASIARYELSQGVTSFLGTTLSLPCPKLEYLFTQTGKWMREPQPEMAALRGIYMEGPYLNLKYVGSHNPDHLAPPDLDAFLQLIHGAKTAIRVLSLAPELPGAMRLIQALSHQIRITLGHSDCDYKTAAAAFAAGASMVTHIFNAMAPLHHREPALIGAAFDYAEFVELISDGYHLHPSVVRAIFKLFGPERVVLISDSTRATGMPDGSYDLGGLPTQLQNGAPRLADGRLAGSAASLLKCAQIALSFGIPLEDIVRAVTINPARAAGLDACLGSLEVGKRADILLINQRFELQTVILGGQVVQA